MSWLFRGLRLRVAKAGREALKREPDSDLYAEPQEHLPDAEITEAERLEAVRRYQRELREKGRG